MSLRTTNLNLLPVLRALLKEASVTRAASELGLSQPATSNALNRLRLLLGDPLLVQIGRTMRLTPRAQRLLPMLDNLCDTIEHVLLEAEFVPAQAQRCFVVATPDYMALLLGPALVAAFAARAPGVSVRFTDVREDIRDQLASGAVDVAIIAWIEDLMRGLSVERGYRDRIVGVVASDHALAHAPPADWPAIAAWPMIGIEIGFGNGRTDDNAVVTQMWSADGSPLRLGASQFLLMPLLAARTQCVALVPQALADYVASMVPITAFDLPQPALPIDICLTWSPLYEADAAHGWFRGLLDEAMRAHFAR